MWYQLQPTLYLWADNTKTTLSLAAFDLDWTLIRPRNGTFPLNINDNIIMDRRIEILKKYQDGGYTIIILTNQKVTSRNPLDFKLKRLNNIGNLFKSYGIQVMIFMSISDDMYRKPNIGMISEINQIIPNSKIVFYCGDAAGRNSDFSDSDLKFAQNAGINFYLPETIFNQKN